MLDTIEHVVDANARALQELVKLIEIECERRLELYDMMTPRGSHDKTRITYCFDTLYAWAEDPVLYLRDAVWAPDPKGDFGGLGKLPDGYAPKQMVPFIPSPAQEEFAREFIRKILSDKNDHGNVVKTRQVAFTTAALGLADWLFRFQGGVTGGLSSREEDLIDKGGERHRDLTGLFPRFRMMSDAVVWRLPHLRYNLHRGPEWAAKREKDNPSLFTASQDVTMKLTRPTWMVIDRVVFQAAESNVIVGAVPGPGWQEGNILTYALLDEFPLYNARKAAQDTATRDAILPACKSVWTAGTIPPDGGIGTEFKALFDRGDTLTLNNYTIDWSDVFAYILFAEYKCGNCGLMTRYHQEGEQVERVPGPGPKGIERTCAKCGAEQTVRRFSMRSIPTGPEHAYADLQPGEITSPWWVEKMDSLGYDRLKIARYYLRSFLGAAGDRAFYTFDRSSAVTPERPERKTEFWRTVRCIDPGGSDTNPAAFVMLRYSELLSIPRIVGWHMAAHKPMEWWTPFFKGWSAEQMDRQVIMGGAHTGRRWGSEYHYTESEREMLDRMARYPAGRADVAVGDKFGSHFQAAAGGSEYDVLARYQIHVEYQYTQNRHVLIDRLRDLWCPRLEIDPWVAEYRPVDPRGREYPSITDCLDTARMRTTTGQAEVKRDIDKNNPPHVSHPVDCLLYGIRELPDEIHGQARLDGHVHEDPEEETPYEDYSDGGGIWGDDEE